MLKKNNLTKYFLYLRKTFLKVLNVTTQHPYGHE